MARNSNSSLTVLWIILTVFGGLVLMACCGMCGCVLLPKVFVGVANQVAKDVEPRLAEQREQEKREVAAMIAAAIDAEALQSEYVSNEAAGDEKYKGKVIDVKGNIIAIGTDAQGGAYLDLWLLGSMNNSCVRCTFAKKNQGQLRYLRQYDRVIIRGECTGCVGKIVQLRECNLTKKL